MHRTLCTRSAHPLLDGIQFPNSLIHTVGMNRILSRSSRTSLLGLGCSHICSAWAFMHKAASI